MYMIDGIQVFKGDFPQDFRSVLVVLQQDSEWILVRNKFRGWEFPGGHREGEETYTETALREAEEEAGAIVHELRYLGFYILPDGHKTVITTAKVQELRPLPHGFETVEVQRFSVLPEDLSFRDGLYEFVINNLM